MFSVTISIFLIWQCVVHGWHHHVHMYHPKPPIKQDTESLDTPMDYVESINVVRPDYKLRYIIKQNTTNGIPLVEEREEVGPYETTELQKNINAVTEGNTEATNGASGVQHKYHHHLHRLLHAPPTLISLPIAEKLQGHQISADLPSKTPAAPVIAKFVEPNQTLEHYPDQPYILPNASIWYMSTAMTKEESQKNVSAINDEYKEITNVDSTLGLEHRHHHHLHRILHIHPTVIPLPDTPKLQEDNHKELPNIPILTTDNANLHSHLSSKIPVPPIIEITNHDGASGIQHKYHHHLHKISHAPPTVIPLLAAPKLQEDNKNVHPDNLSLTIDNSNLGSPLPSTTSAPPSIQNFGELSQTLGHHSHHPHIPGTTLIRHFGRITQTATMTKMTEPQPKSNVFNGTLIYPVIVPGTQHKHLHHLLKILHFSPTLMPLPAAPKLREHSHRVYLHLPSHSKGFFNLQSALPSNLPPPRVIAKSEEVNQILKHHRRTQIPGNALTLRPHKHHNHKVHTPLELTENTEHHFDQKLDLSLLTTTSPLLEKVINKDSSLVHDPEHINRGSRKFSWDDVNDGQTSNVPHTTLPSTPESKENSPKPVPTLSPWYDGYGK